MNLIHNNMQILDAVRVNYRVALNHNTTVYLLHRDQLLDQRVIKIIRLISIL